MNDQKKSPCYRPTKRFKTATEGCHRVELAMLMAQVDRIVMRAKASDSTQVSRPFVFQGRKVQLKFRRLGGFTIKSKQPIIILDDLTDLQEGEHNVWKTVIDHFIVGFIIYVLSMVGNTVWSNISQWTILLSG